MARTSRTSIKRTPRESRQYWEERLLGEYLEAMDAFRTARERVDRLHGISQDSAGSPDGSIALAHARAINRAAHERCRDALDAFNNVILLGKIPDGEQP